MNKRRVVFVFGRERQERLERFQKGEGPDDFLYGMNHFDPAHWQADFVAKDDSQWSVYRYAFELFERVISWRLHMGFALHTILEERRVLQQADVIISTADTMGLPIAFLKSMGIIKTPLIYMSQGLSDRLENLPKNSLSRWFFTAWYGHLLEKTEKILVLGEGAIEPLQKVFKQNLKVAAVPFGVDSDFWSPGSDSTMADYVLTVGSDKGRDYPTLLRAIGDVPLRVVTMQQLPADLLKSSITIGTNYSDIELRELYRHSKMVVIPLRDIAQPSGQSATLQAMACGRAVILTKTRGLWEPEVMQHMKNCYLVPPNDPAAMTAAIQHLLDHPDLAAAIGQAARQTVLEHYSSDQFALALQKVI